MEMTKRNIPTPVNAHAVKHTPCGHTALHELPTNNIYRNAAQWFQAQANRLCPDCYEIQARKFRRA
jgi:hypothetical protein